MSTRLLRLYSTALIVTVLLVAGYAALLPASAQALSGSDFRAGRIIDDGIFYAPNTMTVQQIQDFLNAKVPTCDTMGTQMRGSVTRAQYGNSQGVPPPYTCLRDFRQNTTAKPAEAGLCNGYPAANHSAADIIYVVAQSCGINPKTLLVLLQKEQALITDDWPWPIQYRAATGYGCPDTAACDSQYYGFFNQVYNAARGFKYYAKYADSFNHIAGRNNSVRYNPSSNCGASTVFIQNQSTAGLYNYTPYQPNAAALNNLYGTGDSCSAYGNRNFWRLFSDWFGSTSDNIPISYNTRLISAITINPTKPAAGEVVTVSYTVKNFDPNNAVTIQNSILQCRLLPNTNCDPAYNGSLTLPANGQHTFTQTLGTMQTGGSYALTPYFMQNGTWYRFGTDTINGNQLTLTIPGMRLVSPVTLSPTNPVAGDIVTATYTVQNFGLQSIYYQTSILQCRRNISVNCDPAYDPALTIAPNERRTFTVNLGTMQGGSYNLVPYYFHNDTWYRYGTWGVASANSHSVEVPDVRLVGNITSNITNPIPGQSPTISYTVRNFGSDSITFDSSILQCRRSGANCDPSYEAPVTLAANEQRSFTVNLGNVKAGTYVLTPYFNNAGNWYRFGVGTASANQLTLNVPAYVADMQLTGNITASPTNPIPGQTVTVSYTVRNNGSLPAIYQNAILQCRRDSHTVCDPDYEGSLTINAGASRTFSMAFTAKAGNHTFIPLYLQNDNWHRYGLGAASSNQLNLNVPAFVAHLRLTGPITISPANPSAGQSATVSFTVQNDSSLPAILQTSILQCRRNNSANCDPNYDSPITIAANATRTFSYNLGSLPAGSYRFVPYYMQNDTWYNFGYYNGVNTLTKQVP